MSKKVTYNEFLQRMQELAERIRDEVTPFPKSEMTDAAMSQRKKLAEADPLYMAKTYFPHRVTDEFAPFHAKMVEVSEVKNRIVCVAGFRGCAKSELLALVQPIRWGLFRMRRNIGFVSEGQLLAAERTGDIKVELETNPRLVYDFGDQQVFGQWEFENFKIRNGCHYQAFGRKMRLRGGKSRGERFDQWIFDDYEDPRTTYNPQMVQKGLNQVKQDAVGATNLKDWGLTFLCNYFSKNSVAHQLLNDEMVTNIIIRAEQGRKPSWPQRYTWHDLKNLEKVLGSILYQIEMMQVPRDDEGKDFREEWIKYWLPGDYKKRRYKRVAFLDPSMKKNENNDYKALVVVDGFYDPIEYCTRYAWIRHASVAEMVEQLYWVDREFRPESIGIEENNIKEYLQEILEVESQKKGYYLPIKWVCHTAGKDERIRPKSVLVEQGKAKYVKGDTDQDILVAQTVAFPDPIVHDDGPDSWAGAIDMLKPIMAGMEYSSVAKGVRAIFRKIGTW